MSFWKQKVGNFSKFLMVEDLAIKCRLAKGRVIQSMSSEWFPMKRHALLRKHPKLNKYASGEGAAFYKPKEGISMHF